MSIVQSVYKFFVHTRNANLRDYMLRAAKKKKASKRHSSVIIRKMAVT